mmetsp:Transcript_9156/g.33805  ORF Transcript_9156/g.33805 Transcript_9156/m.33805 type:complete len:110 (+) Transcript_9156:1027-1356(+)
MLSFFLTLGFQELLKHEVWFVMPQSYHSDDGHLSPLTHHYICHTPHKRRTTTTTIVTYYPFSQHFFIFYQSIPIISTPHQTACSISINCTFPSIHTIPRRHICPWPIAH